jgi:hypothetical protein
MSIADGARLVCPRFGSGAVARQPRPQAPGPDGHTVDRFAQHFSHSLSHSLFFGGMDISQWPDTCALPIRASTWPPQPDWDDWQWFQKLQEAVHSLGELPQRCPLAPEDGLAQGGRLGRKNPD